ncbi:MAG: hypothetical protein JST93_09725 [Acidobacteria bacterium]|nr:hypothetical protein [Acidobacteriota bacterium]
MHEAHQLFRCFLGKGPVPAGLAQTYESAATALQIPTDPLTARLIEAHADLAAAEYARRLRHPSNPLTLRAQLLLSLAEARPECLDAFLLNKPSAPRAWLALATAPFEACYRFAKGTLLLWWHARGL